MKKLKLKKILYLVLLLEIYRQLFIWKVFFLIPLDSFMYVGFICPLLIVSSTGLYLFKQNQTSKYYLVFAYLISLLQIVNEMSYIDTILINDLGVKSFSYYLYELLMFAGMYILVLSLGARQSKESGNIKDMEPLLNAIF